MHVDGSPFQKVRYGLLSYIKVISDTLLKSRYVTKQQYPNPAPLVMESNEKYGK